MPTTSLPFLPHATGEMARRLRETDWSLTPLGPIDAWPSSLRIAVGICMSSRFPMFVWWGDDHINLYNDAYIPVLGKRHPDAFGKPAREFWEEIWPVVGPQAEAVMKRGEATWNERVLLVMERNGYTEDTYFTWSYSPIHDETRKIAGLFCACTEETPRLLAERERDRLAELQRESDSRARTILESITDGFFSLSRDWRFLYMNPQAERVLGRQRSDLIGKYFWDEYAAVRGTIFERIYQQAMTEGIAGSATLYYAEHDRHYQAHAYPASDGISVYFTDITDHHVAGELLRTSEERLALAVEAGELGTFYCPMPLGEIIWNDKCKEHFWLPPDAKINFDVFYSILHPDDRDRTREAVEKAIFDHRAYDIEYRTVGPEAQIRWVRAKGRGYYDAAGNPTRFDGITLDITEQKRADAEVREREARFRHLADAMPQIVWAAEPDGRPIYFNRRWYDYTGMAEGPVDPEYLNDIMDEESLARVREAWARAVGEGSPFECEYRMRRSDGALRWHLGRAIAIRDDRGQITTWFGTATDIDDRKRGEEERTALLESERAARSEADRASRMKDEFLATLSHELRTPLNAILGWSQIIRRGGKRDAAEIAQAIEVIERNARSQAQIIEDLLEMSRIISGKVRVELNRLDLAELMQDAIETARPSADAKGVALTASIDAPADKTAVLGDSNRLRQVFWNLINNAIKFTPAGGRVEVRLRSGPDARTVEFDVSDTGEGIRADFLPHVFDRFRQADASTTRRFGGLGLGLSIVKQLVELHGGSVRAASAGTGQGATFVVSLPLIDPSRPLAVNGVAAESARAMPTPEPNECIPIAGLRVLVVDDEADARQMLQRVLEECEVSVTVAHSADEALARLSADRFDLLISDIGMPGEDGHSLIRRVRALGGEPGQIPAVALTAYARASDRVKAIRAGFEMHMAKPVDAAELLAIVASLGGKR